MKRVFATAAVMVIATGLGGCSPSTSSQGKGAAGAEASASPTSAQSAAVPAQGTSIVRFDPALDAIIPRGAVLEKVASGAGWAEGPVWIGDRLRFSDLLGNKLYEITPAGEKKLLLDKSGGLDNPPAGSYSGSNGSVVDKAGTLFMTQHGLRRIVRVDGAMKLTPVIERIDGKRLNSPNDMAFAPDGALWFTDPPYGLVGRDKDPAKEVSFNGVYRFKDGVLKAVITDLSRPNGIGFSPDGKKLYVSNSEPDMFVNVYDVASDGTVSKGRKFIGYPGPNPGDLPDGLKVDSRGNVWTSGPGGIRIVNAQGKVLGQLKSPDAAQSNLAWGDADRKTAYITAAANVYKLRLAIPGEPPPQGK